MEPWPSIVSPFVAAASLPIAGAAAQSRTAVTSERESARKARVVRMAKPKAPDEENPLVHSFEKAQTAEEYGGGARKSDGSDEMNDHGEALDELTLDRVIRSDDVASSVYRADVTVIGDMRASEASAEESVLRYPEWDARRGKYLEHHCSLKISRPDADPHGPAWLSSTTWRRARSRR